jgi:hypothetical protein
VQWLIDLVIAAIGIPPVFIDRGDPNVVDFAVGDFTKDGGWHDLDLSGIIPSNASCVGFFLNLKANAVGKLVRVRTKGNIWIGNISMAQTEVANLSILNDCFCPVGSDGLLEYQASAAGITDLTLTVKGWWLR